MKLFSKLKTLIQINNSNNKTIKGNNNIITGNNSTVIQTPVSVEETTLILGETIVLSEFEKVNDTTYLVYELRTGIMFYIEENDEIGFIVTADENSLEAYLQSKIK